MIELITGNNHYEISRYLDAAKRQFIEESGVDAVIETVDAAESAPDLINLTNAASLFSRQRLVIIYHPTASSGMADSLLNRYDEITDDTRLILVEPNISRSTKLYRLFNSRKQLREFNTLSRSELRRWISRYVADAGGRIGSAAANQLLDYVGDDQWRLSSEIDKLLLLSKEITTANVGLMVEPSLKENVFSLLDAIIGRRRLRAHDLLKRLRLREVDFFRLVSLLSWQIHLLLVAKTNAGGNIAKTASESKLSAFALSKAASIVKRVGLSQLRAMLETVLEIEYGVKSGKYDGDRAAEVLIDRLATL